MKKRKKSLCGFVPYDKYQLPSMVEPARWLSYMYGDKKKERLPARAILCFSKAHALGLKHKRREFQKTLQAGRMGCTIDSYKKNREQVIVVSDFGVGAPATLLCAEKLRVLGVKEFITLGWMGALSDKLLAGTPVLCKKAFRGEGTSYHYLESSRFVKLSQQALSLPWIQKHGLRAVQVWTTDAPFRESKKEYIQFKNKGIECVDMESAALMAFGIHYKLKVFCMGVVSDHLSLNGWKPGFLHPSVKKNLSGLLNQILFL